MRPPSLRCSEGQRRKEPARAPEIRLPLEAQDRGIAQWPAREGGLTMVGRSCTRTLRQFFKFTTERIMHFQSLGNFLCDIAVVCSPGMLIGFLKKDDVRIRSCQEFDNGFQFRTASYVPAHDAKRGRTFR